MGNLLRKGFLLGLGAAVSGKEKLDLRLKELVDKNELTQDQARTVMDNFLEKGELKKVEWSDKQHEQTKQIVKDLGIATKEDLDALRMRVTDLEEKIEQ